MARTGDSIANPLTGETVTFQRTRRTRAARS